MKITAEMLKAKDACQEEIDIFLREWPEGVELSEAAVMRASELKLNIYWFAVNFLEEAVLEEFNRAEATAWEEYNPVTATARKEYDRVMAPARKSYKRTEATAWEKFNRAKAVALIAANKKMGWIK